MLRQTVFASLLVCLCAFTQDSLPYFPVGGFVYNYPEEYSIRLLELDGSLGTNFVCPYFDTVPLNETGRYMDKAHELNMMVHYGMSTLGSLPPSKEKTKNITRIVTMFKDHPALFGWYIGDEPDCGRSAPPFCSHPEWLEDTYKTIKSIDSSHPVSVLVNVPSTMHFYVNASDISMSDPYPCGHDSVEPVDIVASHANTLSKLGQPFIITPQAWGGDNEGCSRTPTPQEERVMSYLAVIHGASGIQYFARGLKYPVSSESWNECRRVAVEMQELSSILVNGQTINVQTFDTSLHCTAWREVSNVTTTVIMCANAENYAKPLLVSTNLDMNSRAEVMFENQELDVRKGVIFHFIEGYGTRVYRIVSGELSSMVDTNNMVLNPSFELETTTSVPDGVAVQWQGFDSYSYIFTDSRVSMDSFHSLRHVISDDFAVISLALCHLNKSDTVCNAVLDTNKTYEFSFFGKGSGNVTLFFELVKDTSKEFVLESNWKRFSFTSFGGGSNVGYNVTRGLMWIDLIQVVPL